MMGMAWMIKSMIRRKASELKILKMAAMISKKKGKNSSSLVRHKKKLRINTDTRN